MAFFVYRYVDVTNDQTKYIGIVYGRTRTLEQRIREHMNDDWFRESAWRIEYFTEGLNSRSDCEIWEGHLIAVYETYKWYNEAKRRWGKCSFLKDTPSWAVWGIDILSEKPNSIAYKICKYLAENGIVKGNAYEIFDRIGLITPFKNEEDALERIVEHKTVSKVIDVLSQLNIINVRYEYKVIDLSKIVTLDDGSVSVSGYTTDDSDVLRYLPRDDVGVSTTTILNLTAPATSIIDY